MPNLHDHTFEVNDGMHDLKSTRSRFPDIKLGPDLNWLIRGGVDPVDFIREYGKQVVCLHIRDQTASGQWTDAVGEGATDFPAIAQVLRDVHFNGDAAIELAYEKEPAQPVRENWKKSPQYVATNFG